MASDWLILHAGALGDLVLMLQLALRLPGVSEAGTLNVISRTNPGDLSACRPSIRRRSSEGLGLHWLHQQTDDPPPAALHAALHGARILSALGEPDSAVHAQLLALQPAAVFSFDPRPRAGLQRHVTEQWQTDLEAQGLLIPKCVHQRPEQRGLGVPAALRWHGKEVLRSVGSGTGAILLHPGSGGRDKCWPLPCFLQLAELLRRRGLGVCFVIGPVELEWWPRAELATIEQAYPVLQLPSPGALAAALAAASAVVANDSGPAHLAALLGTRTTVIFGPTSASVWRPLGPNVEVITGTPAEHPSDWGLTSEDIAKTLGR